MKARPLTIGYYAPNAARGVIGDYSRRSGGTGKPERRFMAQRVNSRLGALEIRKGTTRTISGYAARYDEETDIGEFIEVIRPRAFAETVASDDIRALWNHDSSIVLGRTAAGTLRLEDRTEGLWFELELPKTQAGDDALVSIRRGDVTGMSFGFLVPAGGDRVLRTTRGILREINKVKLYEVSPVTFPAYQGTSVSAA
jgi:HK97 family phage prohead protease